LGAPDVLPVPERHAGAGGEPREGGAHAQAGAYASRAPGQRRGGAAVRRGGAPGEGRRVHGGAGPRHARAVLLHGNPAGRAGGAERAGRGPGVRPGEGARQREKGAARAGREPCGTRAAPLLPPARRGGTHGGARRRRRLAGRAGAAGSRLAVHDAGVYSYIRGATEEGVSPGASPRVRDMKQIHSTTILCVRRDSHVALGGDGQVTIGDTVMKANANKVRALKGGKILAGFAGAAADAFTLFEKFEEKLERYPGNLPRAAVELAKDWR